MMWKPALTLAMMLTAAAGVAAGGNAPQVEKGRSLAMQRCAGCHAIGSDGASPNPAAPRFRDLYKSYPVDALRPALQNGLRIGHRDMPTFVLTPDEVTGIVAFLHDLDPCGKPASDEAAMARCFAPAEP